MARKSLIPKPWDFEPKHIGEHIRKERLRRGLRQIDVASILGVNICTIINWEKGATRLQTHQVAAIIRFLEYDPEPPNPKTIAEHLMAKRREFGWTQKTAAQTLGVDPCTWSSWEGGGMIVALKHKLLIAKFLGLSTDALQVKMKERYIGHDGS